jgi:hypothetical protein
MDERLTPGTPEWWLDRLSRQLDDRTKLFKLYDDYYEGNHPLAFATSKYSEAFGDLFASFSDNWTAMVVQAKAERLRVEGIRIGDDTESDKDAWRIWQANELDSDSALNTTETLINGYGYMLVWAGADALDEDTPAITVEDPRQVTVAYVPGSRRKRAAALKRWEDEEGYELANLYLPGGLYKFRSMSKASSALVMPADWYGMSRWAPREIPGEPWPLPNPIGEVPIVEFQNDPRVRTGGVSEIRHVIPIQDGINKLTADMFIAAEFSAFRQRWATGIEIPVDPSTGKPIEAFKAAVDRIWASANDNTSFGEFSETNLQNYVKAIELLVQHVAAQTSTPRHYLFQSGQSPSGDAIKSAETGLVAKVLKKQLHLGERYEEVIRLAFRFLGDPRGNVRDSSLIWGDPESRTEGELVDALVKMASLGVPNEFLWERWGLSPLEIRRIKALRLEAVLEAVLDESFSQEEVAA